MAMSFLRLVVTVAVAVPLFLIVGWPHPWWVTALIAVVALGAGHGAEALLARAKGPSWLPAGQEPKGDSPAPAVVCSICGAQLRGEEQRAGLCRRCQDQAS